MPKKSPKGDEVCQTLQTAFGAVSFRLIRIPRRRNLTITVRENAEVIVRCAISVPESRIHNFLHKKSRWILRNREALLKKNQLIAQKTFEDGQEYLFLGRKYPINVALNDIRRPQTAFDGQKWSIQIPSDSPAAERPGLVKDSLVQWYQKQAKEILGGRTFHWARAIGVEPQTIVVKTQKRLWGSCLHREKKIHLNWQIIMSPFSVIDYVVVHELCHLRVPNHSSKFWKMVEKFLPDYLSQKKWLKINAFDMALP